MKHKENMKQWAKNRAKMVAMQDAGKTLSEIGKIFDITAQRVHQLIKKEREKTK